MQLHVPSNTSTFATPDPQHQVPAQEFEPGPSDTRRRRSEVEDALNVSDVEFEPNLLTQPLLENQPPISSTDAPYHGCSGPSLACLSAQYPAAGPAPIVPISGPSSQTHRGSVDFRAFMDPFQDDLIAALPITGPAPYGDSSQIGGYSLPQQATSSAAPAEARKIRWPGKRKRVDNPKDEQAAKRLRCQRESDAKNLEELRQILRVGVVQKKDLIGARTCQPSCISFMMNVSFQWSSRQERSWVTALCNR
jgi:hypothetical protein